MIWRAGLVVNLARAGFDVVLDYVLCERLLESFVRKLKDIPVLFCGVTCSISELETLEKARGDPVVGLAKRQSVSVHFCQEWYDLELNSTSASAVQLAEQVLQYLDRNEISDGFPGIA